MKSILNIFLVVLLASCNSITDTSNANQLNAENSSTNEVLPVKPCELFSTEQLAFVFNIQDKSTIEMYDRSKHSATNQCQFIWPEEKGSLKSSQIMINITRKTPDDGSSFSRKLELDLQNGLSASENGKVVIIKPKEIEGFGNFAYHWAQPNFQNTQKIKFQLNDLYMVEILFNSNTEVLPEDIENKLIKIGEILNQKLE